MKKYDFEIRSVNGKFDDHHVKIELSNCGRWVIFIDSFRMTSCASLKDAIEWIYENRVLLNSLRASD